MPNKERLSPPPSSFSVVHLPILGRDGNEHGFEGFRELRLFHDVTVSSGRAAVLE